MPTRMVVWKSKGVIVLLFVVAIFFLNLSCRKSDVAAKEEEALKKLATENWQIKREGLNEIIPFIAERKMMAKRAAENLTKALKDELQRRELFNSRERAEGKSDAQIKEDFDKMYPVREYGDYLVSLTGWLAEKKVKGTLPIVFQVLVNTEYMVNVAWPTFFGNEAYDFLLKKLSGGSEKEQEMAFRVLSVWVSPGESDDFDMSAVPPLTASQKEELLPVFLKGLASSNQETVYLATSASEAYIDIPEVKSKLIELSKPEIREDIRDEAKRILGNASK